MQDNMSRVTQFFQFIDGGDIQQIEGALKARVNPNVSRDDKAALHDVLDRSYRVPQGIDSDQRFAIVRLLVEKGARVNPQDFEESTPLHYVARLDDLRIAQFLIAHSADVDAIDSKGKKPRDVAKSDEMKQLFDQVSPMPAEARARKAELELQFFACVTAGDTGAVKALIDSGVNPNAKDASGDSALHVAARRCDLKMAMCLVENGTNVFARDKNGEKPHDLFCSLLPEVDPFSDKDKASFHDYLLRQVVDRRPRSIDLLPIDSPVSPRQQRHSAQTVAQGVDKLTLGGLGK